MITAGVDLVAQHRVRPRPPTMPPRARGGELAQLRMRATDEWVAPPQREPAAERVDDNMARLATAADTMK